MAQEFKQEVLNVTHGKDYDVIVVGGGIAGTSVAGTTIDDCRFGGQFKGSSGDPVALMSDNVCGDKNFTGSGNTLWDGK